MEYEGPDIEGVTRWRWTVGGWARWWEGTIRLAAWVPHRSVGNWRFFVQCRARWAAPQFRRGGFEDGRKEADQMLMALCRLKRRRKG